uniref:Uncharacterized protein n=1 Tax=Anguilla anguilla TaxID=7936 RepID=A0A0E9VKH5_ANGAN
MPNYTYAEILIATPAVVPLWNLSSPLMHSV